jgi:hypothetical protein
MTAQRELMRFQIRRITSLLMIDPAATARILEDAHDLVTVTNS